MKERLIINLDPERENVLKKKTKINFIVPIVFL